MERDLMDVAEWINARDVVHWVCAVSAFVCVCCVAVD